tara:strand:- start:398 stop:982 length:585 start_codon:yes stop_codon:yes gene_type:complete
MGYQIGDRKLPLDVAWTDADGIQRPANFLRLSTERDRELLGITWVADSSNNYDQRFYWGVDNPKQLNDEAILDEDGNDTGEVQTGLKTLWKAKQNEIAASLLAPSDWRVIKAKETSTNIPSTWKTYRAAVRTACNTRQSEIDACSDVAALKELLYGSAQIQQTDDDGNGVVDDDGNPVMIANPNLATAWPDPVA